MNFLITFLVIAKESYYLKGMTRKLLLRYVKERLNSNTSSFILLPSNTVDETWIVRELLFYCP